MGEGFSTYVGQFEGKPAFVVDRRKSFQKPRLREMRVVN